MPEDTAPAAQDNTIPAGANDFTTELTAEQEAAFVDSIIGPQPTVRIPGGSNVTKPASATTDTGASDADPKEDPKPADGEEPKVTPPKAEDPKETPEEVKPVEIPDVQTDDLWVEIDGLVLDDEGKPQPKTFKITVEDGIPEEMRFKSEKQLAETVESMQEMKALLKQREADHDTQVKDQEAAAATIAAQQATLESWQAEDDQLVEAGLLDAPKAPPANGKQYTAEEVAADPGLQLRDEVYKFMAEENEKRTTEKKPKLAGFTSAFNLYQKGQKASEEASKKAEEEAEAKKQADLIKQRGGMVGGGSSSGGGKDQGFVYKAGSAKSIWAVDTSDLQVLFY